MSSCKIIELPKICDPRGNLTFIEGLSHIPFAIQRIYYIYDVPGGSTRAAHAHRNLQQFFVSMSGSFDLHLDDGHKKTTYHMNRPYWGVYVCPMIWRDIDNFSTGSTCMVIASEKYEEDDYIRDYNEFQNLVTKDS